MNEDYKSIEQLLRAGKPKCDEHMVFRTGWSAKGPRLPCLKRSLLHMSCKPGRESAFRRISSFLLLEALYERSYGAVSFVREISGGETSRVSKCMYEVNY